MSTFNLDKKLVGHWTMDSKDLSNGVMADRSGYGHHAGIRGSPTFNNSSPLGNAGDFVQSDGDYLPIQDKFYTEVEELPEITVSVWFKTTNTNDYIMQYDRSEFFRCTTDVWVTNSDSSGGTSDMTFNAPVDGNWHHVVYWYDSDASGTRKRVYIDNQLDTELSDPHNGTGLGADLTRYGEIAAFGESGSFDDTQDPRFTGQMSDLRLYERALSEEEISALYNMREQRLFRV